jgi:hypothetical protein
VQVDIKNKRAAMEKIETLTGRWQALHTELERLEVELREQFAQLDGAKAPPERITFKTPETNPVPEGFPSLRSPRPFESAEEKLSSVEQQVLGVLRHADQPLLQKEVAERAGVQLSRTAEVLQAFYEQGLLLESDIRRPTKTGDRRYTGYRLVRSRTR